MDINVRIDEIKKNKRLINDLSLSESELVSVIEVIPDAIVYLDSNKITESIFRTFLIAIKNGVFYYEILNNNVIMKVEEALSHEKFIKIIIESDYFKEKNHNYLYYELLKDKEFAFYAVKYLKETLYNIPIEGLNVELLTYFYNDLRSKHVNYFVDFKNEELALVAIKLFPQIINFMDNPTLKEVKTASEMGAYYEFFGSSRKEEHNPNFDDPTELDFEVYKVKNYNSNLLEFPDLIYNTYKVNPSILFDENVDPNKIPEFNKLLEEFLKNKYDINFIRNKYILNNNELMNHIVDLYIGNGKKREYFNKFILKFGLFKMYLCIGKLNYLLEPEFVDTFGYDKVYLIIKFLLVNEKDFNIFNILREHNPKDLKKVLGYVVDDNNVWVKECQKVVNYFSNNMSLFDDILVNWNGNMQDEVRLAINHNYNVSSIHELMNIREYLYKLYDNFQMSNEDKIFKFLFNSNKKDVKFFLDNIISSERISMLKEKYNINIPFRIKKCILLLEKAVSLNDEKSISLMWESLKNEKNIISREDVINYVNGVFYKIYINQLTDIYSLPCKDKDGIKVYELNGEDFSFFIHTKDGWDLSYLSKYSYKDQYTNEYGNGAVATCFINQNHIYGLDGNLILIMHGMKNIIEMGNTNLALSGNDNNDLDFAIRSNANYLLPFEMGMATEAYNDFEFYRQDNNSGRVLPVAGLCYGEIDECIRYGKQNKLTTVVRIPIEKYGNLNNELYSKYLDEIYMFNFANFDKFIGLSHKLKREIPEFIWYMALMYMDENKINEINFLLNKYYMKFEIEKVKKICNELKDSNFVSVR